MLTEAESQVHEPYAIGKTTDSQRRAFFVSEILDLKSFGELDPEDQFRLLAERLCGDLKAIGISMSPYTSRSLLHFRKMPREAQILAVDRLKANYLALEFPGTEQL